MKVEFTPLTIEREDDREGCGPITHELVYVSGPMKDREDEILMETTFFEAELTDKEWLGEHVFEILGINGEED